MKAFTLPILKDKYLNKLLKKGTYLLLLKTKQFRASTMTKRSLCGFPTFKTNKVMTQGESIHELVTIVEECFKKISYSLLQRIPSVLILKHLTSQSVICNQLDMGNHPYTLPRKFKELLTRHYLEDK